MFHVPEAGRITGGDWGSPYGKPYGAFQLPSPEPGWTLYLICDDGTDADVPESLGWEHVSVHARRHSTLRTPTWREMAFVKAQCWDEADCVVQYHPRKSEYVNVHPHVLHLWRYRDHDFPVPPTHLIG